MADITVEEERKRRLDLWTDLEARDLVARARPEDLRRDASTGARRGFGWIRTAQARLLAMMAASQSVSFTLEGTIQTISPKTA
jgi:hypothetical protein